MISELLFYKVSQLFADAAVIYNAATTIPCIVTIPLLVMLF